MPNTGRKIYQFLKQVDSNGDPTGVKKANMEGDSDYVAPVVDYVTCPIVGWQAIDPFCLTQKSCEIGWTLNPAGTACIQTDVQVAAPPTGNGGTAGVATNATSEQWGMGGARIYQPGYAVDGNGSVLASLLTPHFWVNGDTVWSTATRNVNDGRMNACGIWSVSSTPNLEYIGFSRKITVSAAKTMYVGIAGDNVVKIIVNGITKVDCEVIESGPNFNFWNIYPIDLQQGDNFIELYGMNRGSVAGFGAEIYDMTAAELIAAANPGDLNIIFSTATIVGQPFDLGETQGWNCPVGWSLDTSGSGDPVCRRVLSTTPIVSNTGYKGFTNRARITNGILDGYTEVNAESGGTGPYFPPVQDTITCQP